MTAPQQSLNDFQLQEQQHRVTQPIYVQDVADGWEEKKEKHGPNPENANTIPGSCGRAHHIVFSSLRVPFVPACSILRIYAHVPTRYHERILWTMVAALAFGGVPD